MFEAIFLGALQGLTEFLPISSSAHIRIAGELFGTNSDPGATFTAITQIGTELAVLIYFRRDIVRILSAWFSQISRRELQASEKSDARLGWLIILGTLPIVALGYFGQEIIRNDFRSLWLIATTLIVFGIILHNIPIVKSHDQFHHLFCSRTVVCIQFGKLLLLKVYN
mgnify:CR=1 FL=1